MMSIRIILTSPHYPFITPFHKLAAEKQQECKNGLKRKSLSHALRSEKLRLLVTNRKGVETDVPKVRLYSHRTVGLPRQEKRGERNANLPRS